LSVTFNTLIDSYIDHKVGVTENFLSDQLASDLKKNLIRLFGNKEMHAAGTGNDAVAAQNKSVRGDIIYWLDREHNDPFENSFFDLMDDFVSHLNRTCYTGITGYEFHYTLYDAGSFYKKHIDQFRNDKSRQYSMIMYLNEGWAEGDGGELCVYHDGVGETISPMNGKSVFFKSSELEHEVLLVNKPRMSITGWLKIW
jgi:SM-20-related protein